MKQHTGTFASLLSPLRFFLAVLVIAFLIHAAVEFLLPDIEGLAKAIANASMMAVLSVLFLWWFVVIPTSRDITERKRAEETLQALYRLSELLRQSLNPGEVYPAFAEAVKTHLPYDRIGVVVPEGERLVMALSVAEPPLPSYQGMAWPRTGRTAVEWVLAHKQPRLVQDLATEQVFSDEVFIAKEGVRSTLSLPLLVGGEAVGIFFVDSRTPGAYTERDLELLEPLAEQIAFALENARLYAEVKRHAEELEQKVEERTREL